MLAGRTCGFHGNWQARDFDWAGWGGGTLQGWRRCHRHATERCRPRHSGWSAGEWGPGSRSQIMAEVFCAAVEAACDGTGVADEEVIQRLQPNSPTFANWRRLKNSCVPRAVRYRLRLALSPSSLRGCRNLRVQSADEISPSPFLA